MSHNGNDEDAEGFPPDDPTSMLERLDAGIEDLGVPDEQPPSGAPLSRKEIDEVVEQVLAEELARLGGDNRK
jgi:hypothetical protein